MNPINITNDITQWFSDLNSRSKMLKSFNNAAKAAYVAGVTHFVFKATISRGYSGFKHQFSNALFSGLRILIYNDGKTTRDDIAVIGMAILSNQSLVRHLMLLGWDTLEIVVENSPMQFRWPINEKMLIEQ